eukprot:TRINITY_DN63956_c0_g1_i1.p1 TRINITY_DN63956_c0_g1~~TRINITY_DN63956_c0_g1_i1.p1  ORF type:complete len:319 (+),score=37.11 TRINITY_DN63956_c0_g1_i1:48-1004(+)
MFVSLVPAPRLFGIALFPVLGSSIANVWHWRSDMDMATQVTYDLSGLPDHTLYWSCPSVVGERDVEYDVTFAHYGGDTGVTLHNRRHDRHDCLMRKTRVPVDLSSIGRIEVDVRASGTSSQSPWYALWLAPMDYSFTDGSVSAEINLIENRNETTYGHGSNDLHSSFPSCAPDGPAFASGYCTPLRWDAEASDIDHHITLSARDDQVDGRVFEIRHCRNTASPISTCSSDDFAAIWVSKPNPGAPDWLPVWNRTRMGDRFGHYWLVSDIWHTSNTDFELSVSNLRFFRDDGSEWLMPLDDGVQDSGLDNAAADSIVHL